MDIHRDMTKGGVMKQLVIFSLPLLLSNFLQALYNVVDMLLVSWFVDAAGMAAVSNCIPIVNVVLGLIIGLGLGTTILIAQYTGAGDTETANITINNSIILFMALGVVMTVVGIIGSPWIIDLMKTPPESRDAAIAYIQVLFAGTIMLFGYNGIAAIMRGLGDSRTPLLFVFYATLINIVLDIAFIRGFWIIPPMGVAGAAIATITAQGISFILGMWLLAKRRRGVPAELKKIRLDRKIMAKTIKLGANTAIQNVLIHSAHMVLNGLINPYGYIASAAYGVGVRINSFGFMPTMALGVGVATITGQCIGAGDYKRANKTANAAMVVGLGMAIVITALCQFFPREIMLIFTDELEVVENGIEFLRIMSLMFIPFVFMYVSNALIQGAGNTTFPMIVTIFMTFVLRLPLAVTLRGIMGLTGIYWAISATPYASAIASNIYRLSGRWRRSKTLKKIQN